MTTLTSNTRQKRAEAAEHFKPEMIKLLLVAEAPPPDSDRYFYFKDVLKHDSLFRYVIKGLFGVMPNRDKAPWLERLKSSDIFLIDLKLDPLDDEQVKLKTPQKVKYLLDYVPDLVKRCEELEPDHIILIKKTVYRAAYDKLRQAGLPVVEQDEIPFPGHKHQPEFERCFARALRKIGWVE